MQTDTKERILFTEEIEYHVTAPAGSNTYLFIKRVFDIIFALLIALITFPFMLVIALLVRLDSKGPAIYKQERLGKDGKAFLIYKFRSMCEDAEKDGPRWAEIDDSRCTRIGKILRRFHVDELPQLWNVLIGDMSFVGPRPERSYFYQLFAPYVPDFEKRLLVKPGITGLAQVNGGYDLEPQQKLKYDIEYIETRSLMLDLKCLLKTIRLLFSREGAR